MKYKFIVGSGKLKEALSITSKGLSPSRVIPITGDYLFKINSGELTICTTNMQIFINKTIAIESESIIDVVLPSGKLNDLMKDLPDQPLIFEITEFIETVNIPGSDKTRDEKRFFAELKTPSGTFKLNADDGEPFPTPKEDENISSVEIAADDFLAGLYKTSFAVSKDELRPVLTGVIIDFEPNGIRFSASDGHIASTVYVPVKETIAKSSIIVPSDSISLMQSFGLKWPSVKLSFSKSIISFELGTDLIIHGRLIGETPFELKKLIPDSSDYVATADRLSLIAAINRVKGFSNDGKGSVKLSLTANNINIFAENKYMNETGNEDLTVSYDGEDFEIGTIPKQILSCLGRCVTNDVSLFFTTPNRAFLIRESDEVVNQENLMFVMPVMI